MKKLVLMLILVSIGFVYAQLSDVDYSGSHDEETSSSSAETIITSEPITITGLTQTGSDQNQEMDLVIGLGSDLSRNKKVLNIPLAYRWRNFGFSAIVPYIYEKKITGTDFLTRETVDVSTSGIGDVFVGVSYGNLYEPYDLYYDVNVGVKMPTGDTDAVGTYEGIDYALPLGSDSWDINGGVSLFKFDENVTFKSKFMFIYKGAIETITEVAGTDPVNFLASNNTTTTTFSQGAQFISDLGFDYRWKYRLSFSSGISFGWNFDGETETVNKYDIIDNSTFEDYEQTSPKVDIYGMTFADVRQAVHYSISILDLSLGLRVPIYTYSTQDLSIAEIQRNFSVYFRTNYQLF